MFEEFWQKKTTNQSTKNADGEDSQFRFPECVPINCHLQLHFRRSWVLGERVFGVVLAVGHDLVFGCGLGLRGLRASDFGRR